MPCRLSTNCCVTRRSQLGCGVRPLIIGSSPFKIARRRRPFGRHGGRYPRQTRQHDPQCHFAGVFQAAELVEQFAATRIEHRSDIAFVPAPRRRTASAARKCGGESLPERPHGARAANAIVRGVDKSARQFPAMAPMDARCTRLDRFRRLGTSRLRLMPSGYSGMIGCLRITALTTPSSDKNGRAAKDRSLPATDPSAERRAAPVAPSPASSLAPTKAAETPR